jgi:3-hydroxyacyl-CoA dehydrogenase
MTESIGTRWALMGPFMTAVLGGGGGRSGFVRLATHLLPAVEAWVDDMRAHSVKLDDEATKTLDASVQQMLDKYDLDVFEKVLARQVMGLLKLKNEDAKTVP